ncbi:MAG: hypothetical protein IJL20_10610 [Lachnospiraceae bacterium]|nr:hypothetical protein [Lachnospiraceae bacterium]
MKKKSSKRECFSESCRWWDCGKDNDYEWPSEGERKRISSVISGVWET